MARIASRQQGQITRAQLLAAGVTPKGIEHRVRTGRLHRRHRGVYQVGHLADAPYAAEMAGVLAVRDAVAACRSAGWIWSIGPAPEDDVDVVICGNWAKSRNGIRVHRTLHLGPGDVTRRYDVPVTTVPRTLLDLAEHVEARTLERAFNEALAQRLTTREAILALLARSPGRRGAPALRAVLEPDDGFDRSRAERTLTKLLRGAHVARYQRNVKVGRWELDFYFPDARLNVEIDGYAAHITPHAFERDRERDVDLKLNHRIDVLRFSWRMLRDEPMLVIAAIARATP